MIGQFVGDDCPRDGQKPESAGPHGGKHDHKQNELAENDALLCRFAVGYPAMIAADRARGKRRPRDPCLA
jgi:hypothetical protein